MKHFKKAFTFKCIEMCTIVHYSHICAIRSIVFIATWDYLKLNKRNERNMIFNYSTAKECLYQASINDLFFLIMRKHV